MLDQKDATTGAMGTRRKMTKKKVGQRVPLLSITLFTNKHLKEKSFVLSRFSFFIPLRRRQFQNKGFLNRVPFDRLTKMMAHKTG